MEVCDILSALNPAIKVGNAELVADILQHADYVDRNTKQLTQ